jgi:hypothetical protein
MRSSARARVWSPKPALELASVGLSKRDASVLAAMLQRLDGRTPDFGDAARALNEAVVELIPAGRTFILGVSERGPIIGSIISGVGIAAVETGVALVRVNEGRQPILLGSLWR